MLRAAALLTLIHLVITCLLWFQVQWRHKCLLQQLEETSDGGTVKQLFSFEQGQRMVVGSRCLLPHQDTSMSTSLFVKKKRVLKKRKGSLKKERGPSKMKRVLQKWNGSFKNETGPSKKKRVLQKRNGSLTQFSMDGLRTRFENEGANQIIRKSSSYSRLKPSAWSFRAVAVVGDHAAEGTQASQFFLGWTSSKSKMRTACSIERRQAGPHTKN